MLAPLTSTHLTASVLAGDLQISGFPGCKHNRVVFSGVVTRASVLLKEMMPFLEHVSGINLRRKVLNLNQKLRAEQLSLSGWEAGLLSLQCFWVFLDTSTFCVAPDLLLTPLTGGSGWIPGSLLR